MKARWQTPERVDGGKGGLGGFFLSARVTPVFDGGDNIPDVNIRRKGVVGKKPPKPPPSPGGGLPHSRSATVPT